ncbi:MAG: mechanosensitive ion channel family protein [Chloroflexi bacterium]|nr:mechanosensitive ion channel family protein [Chloroflexota bacterium]
MPDDLSYYAVKYLVAAAVGIVVAALLFILRRIFFGFLHRWAARTKSRFDDILVAHIRWPSLLWCFLAGWYAAWWVAAPPVSGPVVVLDRVLPVVLVALGTYTFVAVLEGIIKWYRLEICPRTIGTMDNAIMDALKVLVPVLAVALGTVIVLNMLGADIAAVNDWLFEHGLRLTVLAVLALILLLFSVLLVPGFIKTSVRSSRAEQTEEELVKRAETLVSVIVTSLQLTVIAVFAFMFLSEIGLDIAPILAGVGVVGIAIGFGAQSLVKDFISGFFIVMENQYRKGDVVKVADISGLVEDVNLRRTMLRDLDGIVHVVPNGEIRVSSNFTKQWSRVNFNISVSYGTDLEKAMAVINRVGKELAEEPAWADSLKTPPRALRVDKLGDSGIEIKVLGETKPMRQWDVMGELRLRLKKAFDQEGIEIPWPHTKVYFGDPPPRLWPAESAPREPPAK